MRRFTEKDFQTRERAEKVLLDVLNPLKPYYSESCARLYVGNTSTHYENDTIPMESFARPLWGLVPFWAGGGSDPEFEEIYRKGLEAGPDPEHPDYWHTCRDYDQKFCEMAAIAFGMLFCPEKVWDPLSEKGKDNLTEWFWEINRHECCACNWQFFSIITNVALCKRGRPYDKERLKEGLECIDAYYDAGGWYNSLGKYQIQSRQKEQFYTKDKTALNVILSNCTRPRTVSWETYGDCIFPEGRESSHFL